MQLAKKLQKIVVQNIKIIIGIFIIIILSLIIFYVDIFDLDLFNKKYIANLETELLELKEEINSEKISKNNHNMYYLIGGTILLIGGLLYFYYFNGGDNDFMNNSSNILNQLSVEEAKVKYHEDKIARRLDFLDTPSPSPPKNIDRYTSNLSPIYEKSIKSLKDI